MKISRSTSLFLIALVALAIAVLQFFAFKFFFYWTFWWYDVMMHGLGGFLIGSIAAWAYAFELKYHVTFNIFFWIVGGTLLIGILWEIFEYVVGFRLYDSLYQSYASDTLSDIGMDVIGSLIVYLVFRRLTHD